MQCRLDRTSEDMAEGYRCEARRAALWSRCRVCHQQFPSSRCSHTWQQPSVCLQNNTVRNKAFGRGVFQYVFCSPGWSLSALLAILDYMPISFHLESCTCKNLNQFFCCRKLLIKAIWAVNALKRLFSLMAFMETHQQHMKQSREWSLCFPKRSRADQGSHGPSGASRMSLEMLNRGLNHRSFVRKACPCHTLHQVVRLQLQWKTAALYISPDAFERPDHKKHCRMTTDLGWTCTHTKNYIRNWSIF